MTPRFFRIQVHQSSLETGPEFVVVEALYFSQMESLAAAYGSDEEDEGERHVPWVGPGLAPLSSTKITVNCAPRVPDKASDANEQQYSGGNTEPLLTDPTIPYVPIISDTHVI